MATFELLLDDGDDLEFASDISAYLLDFECVRGFETAFNRVQNKGEMTLVLNWREYRESVNPQQIPNNDFSPWVAGVPSGWLDEGQPTHPDDLFEQYNGTDAVRYVNVGGSAENVLLIQRGGIPGAIKGNKYVFVVRIVQHTSGTLRLGWGGIFDIVPSIGTGVGTFRAVVTAPSTTTGDNNTIRVYANPQSDLVFDRIEVYNFGTPIERGRWLRLQAVINGNTHAMFTGMIHHLEQIDDLRMRVIVRRRLEFMSHVVTMPMKINVRSDLVLDDIFSAGRNGVRDELKTGGVDYGYVGVTVGNAKVAPSDIALRITDVGRATLLYFGDLEGISNTLDRMVTELALAEGAWLFEDASGNIVFRNRSFTIHQLTVDYALDDQKGWLNYVYGDEAITELTGEYVPRSITLNAVVWTLAQDWLIPSGSSQSKVYVSDDKGRNIGLFGLVTVANLVVDKDILFDVVAEGSVLVFNFINNDMGGKALISAGMTVACDAVYRDEVVTINRRTTIYRGTGSSSRLVGGGAFTNQETISSLMAFYDSALGSVLGRVADFVFIDVVEDQVSLDLMDRVSAIDYVNFIQDDYVIRGIEHRLSSGKLETKLFLIPYNDDLYAIVGVAGRMEVGSVKVGY